MVDSIIFEGSSPRECSNAIRNALSISEDRRKYMSEHAIANAKQNFDYRAWSQKLTEFILG
jgi:trehalose-6-phosphate synthase